MRADFSVKVPCSLAIRGALHALRGMIQVGKPHLTDNLLFHLTDTKSFHLTDTCIDFDRHKIDTISNDRHFFQVIDFDRQTFSSNLSFKR